MPPAESHILIKSWMMAPSKAQPIAVLIRGPGQSCGKRLAAERGPHTHRLAPSPLWKAARLTKAHALVELRAFMERLKAIHTEGVAMGCDPSPAAPEPATARPAEEPSPPFWHARYTPREKNGCCTG